MARVCKRHMIQIDLVTGARHQITTPECTLKHYLKTIFSLNGGDNVRIYQTVYLPDSVELNEFLDDETNSY